MFLRAPSAAKLLDLPLSTFYQLVRDGSLPPAVSKVGRHRLWSREHLIATVDPRGYEAANDQAKAAAGRPPAGSAQRPREVLLPAGAGDCIGRGPHAASRRSPYAGILGGSGDSSPLLGFSGSAAGQDR